MKLFFTTLIFVITSQLSLVKAQNMVFKESTLSHPAEMWKPFKLADGTNLKDGVTFYVYNADCGGKKTKLMKLVNTNSYALTFSYQLAEDLPVVTVQVPAQFTIEGTCDTTDENLKKLTLDMSFKKEKNKDPKTKGFFANHIALTKI